MVILHAGLYVAVAIALLVTWQSSSVGYPIEVAMVRGLVAFMAVSLVAYVAELIVMTAPPARRQGSVHVSADPEDPEDADDADAPANLPAIRAERDAALDDRRAA